MKDDFYRHRLLQGHEGVLPKHSWWPRHSLHMTRYLIVASGKDADEIRRSRDLVAITASEWDSMVKGADEKQKSGFGCMGDHAKLERELVDAALRKDGAATGKIMKSIEKNAIDQSLIYGMRYPGFPEFPFVKLMKEHLEVYFDSVKAYVDGNVKAFDESEFKRKSNTLALVELTAEWF